MTALEDCEERGNYCKWTGELWSTEKGRRRKDDGGEDKVQRRKEEIRIRPDEGGGGEGIREG